jgi:histidinol-phosphate aminotransferase
VNVTESTAQGTIIVNRPIAPGADLPANEYVRGLPPYVAGKPIAEVARQYGLDARTIIKLASNENPLGMPESARQAMLQVMDETGRYPDANGFDLKGALAEKYQVPEEWLTLGNGSNDILELAARAFLAPGKSAVFSQYSFIVYPLAVQAVGAKALVVPATPELGHDLDAMLAAVREDTKLVFVANPNNPTGTFLSSAEIENFLNALPPHVMVVLDEAYNEYLEPELRFESSLWVHRFANLIVSRTFSKAYGLAGLRVGYALSQAPVADLLNRVRQPFNVNVLAQAAAKAALSDRDFLDKTYHLNRAGYLQLADAFRALGLSFVPSYGNFVLVKVGEDAGAGERINQKLLKAGVIVRPVGNYGLPQYLRVSIGLPEENLACIKALTDALSG